MKKTLKSIVLLSALCGGSLHASFQFRTPLFWQDRGYIHWLLAPADDACWYDLMPSKKPIDIDFDPTAKRLKPNGIKPSEPVVKIEPNNDQNEFSK